MVHARQRFRRAKRLCLPSLPIPTVIPVDGRAERPNRLVAMLAVTGGFFVLAGIAARDVGVFVAFPFGSAAILLIAAAGAARGRRWGVGLAVPAGFVTCLWVVVAFALAFLGLAGCDRCTGADAWRVLIWFSTALGLSLAVGVYGLAARDRDPARPPPQAWGASLSPGWRAHVPPSETPFPVWMKVLAVVAVVLWILKPLIEDLLPR